MNNFTASSMRVLISEAESMLNQAKKYRDEMEALPVVGTPLYVVYEKIIRDLLEHSRRLSVTVIKIARKKDRRLKEKR